MKEVVELASREGVEMTVCDMCAYGMVIEDDQGEALVEKRTKFLTNSPEACKRISRRCTNKAAARDEIMESSVMPSWPLTTSGELSHVPTDEAARP